MLGCNLTRIKKNMSEHHIVYIIDDDSAIRKQCIKLLSENFFVSTFDSAEAVLTEVDEGNFADIYVIDIIMPGMNGIQLLRELRIRNLQNPAIIISAQPEKSDALEALNLGAFALLVKPLS
ncbi:MAG: response regulator, partial [Candidatus Lokiarchaeota archaeon]|nr:response regulator [Candidatus Lokiarchaeota archaeon]